MKLLKKNTNSRRGIVMKYFKYGDKEIEYLKDIGVDFKDGYKNKAGKRKGL